MTAAERPEPGEHGFVNVYCEVCHKTHLVLPDEQECEPGAWLVGGERWPSDA